MTQPRRLSSSGFTLIELLVVIAIIALLVSILLPTLRTAKDLAKNALCMSTQRGTAMSLAMYLGDRSKSGCLLANWNKPDERGGSDTWIEWLLDGDYAPGMAAIRCGGYKVGRDWAYRGDNGYVCYGCDGYEDDPWIAYGLRTLAEERGDKTWESPFMPKNAAACPWGVDSVGGDLAQFYNIDGWGNSVPHLRHFDKANLFYVDTHVESRGSDELAEYGWEYTEETPHYMFYKGALGQDGNPI